SALLAVVDRHVRVVDCVGRHAAIPVALIAVTITLDWIRYDGPHGTVVHAARARVAGVLLASCVAAAIARRETLNARAISVALRAAIFTARRARRLRRVLRVAGVARIAQALVDRRRNVRVVVHVDDVSGSVALILFAVARRLRRRDEARAGKREAAHASS